MDYPALRKSMVENQLAGRGIKDQRVLNAFYKVERHKFVREDDLNNAYADFPLAIGENQTISQPYIAALMSECLELTGAEKILEIGTGSGYQTAILAELGKEVYSVERIDKLSKKAQGLLNELGYANIKIKTDDGTLGWQEFAPFERIIITAAGQRIPLPLAEQLNEGGKLIMPVGDTFSQMLTLAEKKQGRLEIKEICPCVFVPLINKHNP